MQSNAQTILQCETDFNLNRESLYLTLLQNKRVDSILMTPISGDKYPRQNLVERSTPYVLVDAYGAGAASA